MSRYFQIVDQSILEGLKAQHKVKAERREVAVAWALDHGFAGEILVFRDGLFGHRLGGLTYNKDTSPELREKCTKPKGPHYEIRPRKSGKTVDKALVESYQAMRDWFRVSGRDTDDLIGFNEMSFFPTSPGFQFNEGMKTGFWIMPDHVTEVKGSAEVTNIEFLAATRKNEPESGE